MLVRLYWPVSSCPQSADAGRELASMSTLLTEANAALAASKGNMEAALAKHVVALDAARKVDSLYHSLTVSSKFRENRRRVVSAWRSVCLSSRSF